MTLTNTSPADHDDLAEFGYDQQLHRSLGKFASFAAGFSFVSILTTIFQLFGLGFGFVEVGPLDSFGSHALYCAPHCPIPTR